MRSVTETSAPGEQCLSGKTHRQIAAIRPAPRRRLRHRTPADPQPARIALLHTRPGQWPGKCGQWPRGGLEVSDGVLDLGVAAMVGLQCQGFPVLVGDEAVIGVGGEEGQLGTGPGPFAFPYPSSLVLSTPAPIASVDSGLGVMVTASDFGVVH